MFRFLNIDRLNVKELEPSLQLDRWNASGTGWLIALMAVRGKYPLCHAESGQFFALTLDLMP